MKKDNNLFVLITLGLIWSTFAIFTKTAAMSLSPFFIVFSRLILGGSSLYLFCLLKGKKVFVVKNFKYYAIVGALNSAFPFLMFASAAKHLDTGVSAILDGTIPMFEVLISIFFLKRTVDKNAIFGVIFGFFGIVFTSFGDIQNVHMGFAQIMSVVAILLATNSYAIASLYSSNHCKHIGSMEMACGSILFAAIPLAPSVFLTDFATIDLKTFGSLCGLGFFCTGLAYIFYFKLIAEEGSRIAVSTVLLIPVFGTLFGAMLMGETISTAKILGCITILISMKFILNLSAKNFFRSKIAPLA